MSGDAPAVEAELIARVTALRPAPTVVLDLDGTLLDNRPRMRAILLEWVSSGDAGDVAPGGLSALDDDRIFYRVEDTLAAAGVTDPALVTAALAFWRRRFFTEDYLCFDRPNPGAVGFVRRLHAAGARLVYLTGRDLQNMVHGTLTSLRAHGFPVLAPRASLCMKPDPAMHDLAYKLEALTEIEAQGRILAFIDNDPRQCEAFAERYPDPDRFTILFGTNRPPDARARCEVVRQLATF